MPARIFSTVAVVGEFFLSHATADKSKALRVEERLTAGGHRVFVDSDHDDGIEPGSEWMQSLFRELRLCHAVVFLNSATSQRSMWCHTELAIATELGKPIYPVNLEVSPPLGPHSMLAHIQAIRLETSFDDSLDWLTKRLDEVGLSEGPARRWDRRRKPFPGLRSFEAADAGVFFGRDNERRHVLARVDPPLGARDGHLVVVMGPSGSGKSSLVKAGVLPSLSGRDNGWLVLDPFEPGTAPLDRLVSRLVAVSGGDLTESECRQDLATLGLARVTDRLVNTANPRARRLLVTLDQSEQLTTTAQSDECTEFLRVLASGLVESSPLTVLATLRSDRLDEFQRLPLLGEKVSDPVTLAPLRRTDLSAVIEQPAAKADVQFDAGVVATLIDDATNGSTDESAVSALPLLAFTLRELYDIVTESGRNIIVSADYKAVGGIAGAVARRAAEAEQALPANSAAVLDNVLARTVILRDDRPPAARTIPRASLVGAEADVVERLEDQRLLTGEDQTVRIVHEQLFTSWPRLKAVIESRREDLVQQSQLERESADWRKGNAQLLSPERAKRAHDWIGRADPAAVTTDIRDFVDASRRAVRRRRTLITTATAIIAVLAVVSFVLAKTATSEKNRATKAEALAQQQAAEATESARQNLAKALATESIAQGPLDRDRALALAAQAHATVQTPVTTAALYQALARESRVTDRFDPRLAVGEGEIGTYTLSPNGAAAAVTRYVTASVGDQVTFIDLSRRMTVLGSVFGRTGATIVFTDDGHRAVVSGSNPSGAVSASVAPDGTVATSADPYIFRVELPATASPDGKLRQTTEMRDSPAAGPLTLSRDGRFAVGAHNDGTVSVLDLDRGERRQTVVLRGSRVSAVAVSADNTKVAAAAGSSVTVYSLATLEVLRQFVVGIPPVASGVVTALAFSSDGARLGVVENFGGGSNVVLYDAVTGAQRSTPGSEAYFFTSERVASGASDTIRFLADGTVVAGSASETIIFSESAVDQRITIPGRFGGFDRSGTRLVTSGASGRTAVWSVKTGEALGLPFDIAAGEAVPLAGPTTAAVYGTIDATDGEQIVTVGSRLTTWTADPGPPLLRELIPAANSTAVPINAVEASARTKLAQRTAVQGTAIPVNGVSVILRAWSGDGTLIATLEQASFQTASGSIEASRHLVVYDLTTATPTILPVGDAVLRGSDVIAAFSADNKTLFLADHFLVKAVQVRGDVGKQVVLFTQKADITALATGSDGSLAFATSVGDVRVIPRDRVTQLLQNATAATPEFDGALGIAQPGHTARPIGVRFDQSNKLLVTQDSAGVTHVIDVATRVLLVELHGATPAGRIVVSAKDLYLEGPQGFQHWDLDPAKLESRACASAQRGLTPTETQTFLGSSTDPLRCT